MTRKISKAGEASPLKDARSVRTKEERMTNVRLMPLVRNEDDQLTKEGATKKDATAWAVINDDRYYVVGGTHPYSACKDRGVCPLHNPSDHAMRDWHLHWRSDRGIFERLCPEHGTGHPDPDQYAFWEETDQMWQTVHGCCGCCRG